MSRIRILPEAVAILGVGALAPTFRWGKKGALTPEELIMGRLTHRTSPGSTYFVTTKAWQGISVFQVQEIADIVISKLLDYRDKGNYLLHEFVLMPNHLHLVLSPTESVSLEKAIQ